MKFRPLFLLPLLGSPAGAASIVWDQPNANNNWNTTDANWTGGATFVNGDDAIFNSATGESVTVAGGGVLPASTAISGNGAWSFSGGAIGGSLTKDGSGALTLGSANSFSGIALNGGNLNLGNAGALGTGTVTMGTGVSTNTTTTSMIVATSLASGSVIGNAITLPTDTVASNRAIYMNGTANAANTLELSGKISGGSALTTLYLNNNVSGAFNPQFIFSNAANDFRANLLINRGGLRISSNEALGNLANTVTFNSNGGADLTFLNAMTYTRATTLSTDTDFDTGVNAVTASGNITGGSRLTKIGGGTLTLTGANAYGATTISAGTLEVGSGGTAGTLGSGAVTNNASLVINRSNAIAVANNITGSGSLTKKGAGTLTLSGTNGYSAGTSIEGGAISLGNSGALGGGALTISATGTGRLLTTALTGSQTLANNIVLTNPGAAANIGIQMKGGAGNVLTLGGVISGGGANTTLYLDNDTAGDAAGKYILANANTYSGKTYINRGSVQLNHAAGFGTSAVQFDSNANAVLGFNSSMTVSNDISYTFAAKKVDTGANDISLTGVQTFTFAVTKEGSGSLTLTKANSGGGGVTVSAGTLLVNNATGSGTGTGTVTVAASGTLGGTGSIAGSVNVTGVLSPGASIESLVTGNLTMTSGSTLVYEAINSSSTGADLLAVGGLSITGTTLDLTAANLDLGLWSLGDKLTLISYTGGAISGGFSGFLDDTTYTFGSNEWLFDYNDAFKGNNFAGDAGGSLFVTMTVVPEPSSAILGILSLAGLLRRRRC